MHLLQSVVTRLRTLGHVGAVVAGARAVCGQPGAGEAVRVEPVSAVPPPSRGRTGALRRRRPVVGQHAPPGPLGDRPIGWTRGTSIQSFGPPRPLHAHAIHRGQRRYRCRRRRRRCSLSRSRQGCPVENVSALAAPLSPASLPSSLYESFCVTACVRLFVRARDQVFVSKCRVCCGWPLATVL